ncbi:MAG: B12-binding domain-containing protein, partial [Limisphaerales bacterium]
MVIEKKADVLAISATMSYHVSAVSDLIAAVRRSSACGKVKILVGGYPFNIDPDLWRKLGADGYAADAQQVQAVAERILNH